MTVTQSYCRILSASTRTAWTLDDVFPCGSGFGPGQDVLPDMAARTRKLAFLGADERGLLNRMAAGDYCRTRALLARTGASLLTQGALAGDTDRARATLCVAEEKLKHALLLERVAGALAANEDADRMLDATGELTSGRALFLALASHAALRLSADATQDAVDPLFRAILRHLAQDEARHLLLAEALLRDCGGEAGEPALHRLTQLISNLDGYLRRQAEGRIAALEHRIGARLSERDAAIEQQHQAARWTHIGCALAQPRFIALLDAIAPEAADRIAGEAPMFA